METTKTIQKGTFKFKTVKPTGKFKWVDKPAYYIFFNKQNVGDFIEREGVFIPRLKFMKTPTFTDDTNCVWKWFNFSFKGKTLEEVQDFITRNSSAILATHTLYLEA